MASLLFDLIDAHDIINENQNEQFVLSYMEHLSDQGALQDCTDKIVETLISSTHSCLHSKKNNGKRIGLIALHTLCQECADEVFLENGSNWIKMIWPFLQKSLYDEHFERLLLSTIRILVQRAPKFPGTV